MPSTPGTFAGVSLASCQAACARDQDCKFFAMTYDASNKPTCLRYQSTTQNPLALSDCTLAAKLAVWNGLEWSGMQAGRLASGNGPLYVPAAPSHMALHHCLVSVCVCVFVCAWGGGGGVWGYVCIPYKHTQAHTQAHARYRAHAYMLVVVWNQSNAKVHEAGRQRRSGIERARSRRVRFMHAKTSTN